MTKLGYPASSRKIPFVSKRSFSHAVYALAVSCRVRSVLIGADTGTYSNTAFLVPAFPLGARNCQEQV
jgi:hypothetical protein